VAPGGGAVAFALVDAKGVLNVWILDASGRATQVTRDSEGASYPTWSPDARFLAVEVERRNGLHLAYVGVEGGEVVVLTEGRTQHFTGGWSPDGDKIVVSRRPVAGPNEHWNIWWVSRTTGQAQRLTDRPLHPAKEFVRYPSWSVAGDRVWFELAQSSADIWVLDLQASSD
jgi:Tol biopolymer transport system component